MNARPHLSSPGESIRPYDFYLRALWESPRPEMEPTDEVAPRAPRSSGWRGRVIGLATAKNEGFAITVNRGQTIGVVVGVDLERGVTERKNGRPKSCE